MRRPGNRLTERETMVLCEICRHLRQHDRVPGIRELAAALSLQESSVKYILNSLRKQGCIERSASWSRNYKVLKPFDEKELVTIPIVGFLKNDRVLAFRSPPVGEARITCADGNSDHELFALQVLHDGPLSGSASPGDILVFRKRSVPSTGNTAIVNLNGDMKLVKFKLARNAVMLHGDQKMPFHLRPSDRLRVDGILILSFSNAEVTMF